MNFTEERDFVHFQSEDWLLKSCDCENRSSGGMTCSVEY